jgi:hypothetical protein
MHELTRDVKAEQESDTHWQKIWNRGMNYKMLTSVVDQPIKGNGGHA